MSAWLKAVALGCALMFLAQPAWAGDVTVFPDKSRIVAIGGAVTEIVFALGEQGHLVARDSTGTWPKEAMALPDVGYMRALSPEGVLSVEPSGILALQGSGPKEAIEVLKKASVPYVEVPEAYDHDGILERIRVVGKALGVEDKAAALAAETDGRLKAAEARTAGIEKRKRVLFILSMQGGKILAAGKDTAANGIIRLAGAVNAIDGFSGYKQLSDEAVVTAAPDVILMMDHAGPAVSDETLFANAAIDQTPAGAARKVIRMDGGYLLGFGPRTAGAINDLATALYGDTAAN
jgi:iron complex transport system substrate-binding protein